MIHPFCESKPLDLAFGSPDFLATYWTNTGMRANAMVTLPDQLLYYPKTTDFCFPELEKLVFKLHDSIGNAVTQEKNIVFGNGASQLLSAAMYSLGNLDATHFFAPAPFWGNFEFLHAVASSHSRFGNDLEKNHSGCEIITSPNNPDNSIAIVKGKRQGQYQIHDLCYNWPQYTEVLPYDEEIMIFSLAKATGHGGCRLGWALVQSPKIAEQMKNYIGKSTGGVSLASASAAEKILKSQIESDRSQQVFAYGKTHLQERWKKMQDISKGRDEFEILNQNGMYLWGKLKTKADAQKWFEEKWRISVMGGEQFGVTSDYFRLNLGCSSPHFEEFLIRLQG